MDKYSIDTIELLLKDDRGYLVEILRNLEITVDDPSSLTIESVCVLLAAQKGESHTTHESSIYACKCGSKKIIAREMQLRSADEGSTITYICRDCGNCW